MIRLFIALSAAFLLSGMSGCETIRSEGNDPEKYEFGDVSRAIIHHGPELHDAMLLYCDPETDTMVKRVAIKLIQTYIPYPDGGLCAFIKPGELLNEITE